VRYADPEADSGKKKGFLSRLAFWSPDEVKAQTLRYQVRLKGADENTQLAVYMDDGTPANNETGKRIASLLFEQLK
jgi:outer membrane protein assembly factor BamC